MDSWKQLTVLLFLGEVEAEVQTFELNREVGVPFRARIDARIPNDVPPDSLLGASAFLAFGRDEVEHEVAGVITSIEVGWAGAEGERGHREIEVVIESSLALLRETLDCRMFQEQDVQQIVSLLLEEHGVDPGHQRWQLMGTYEPREYCVQWNESAFDFARRLCEEEGIFFWSETDEGSEVIVLSDEASNVEALPGGPVPVRIASNLRSEGDAFTEIEPHERLRSGKVLLRDFAFKTPTIDLEAAAAATDAREGEDQLEQYTFGAGFDVPSVAKVWAKVRMESLRADRRVAHVGGRCARVRPGTVMTLQDAPFELDGDHFVVKCSQHLTLADDGGALLKTAATAVPKDTAYRLPQVTARPVVQGPTVGFVVAPDGSDVETVHTDEHGRVKVRFPWDRSGKVADDASCWMRVAQLQTSGSLMLPRIGWEVLVEHTHGDPDRPMVTGRVYNGATKPPYALPEGKSRMSLQTASSPGGAGRNELRFEDAAGSEEIRIEAQKSHTLATAGNKDTKVGANSLQEVGGTRTVLVSGSQTVKVTGGLSDGIKAAQTVIIGGSRTVNVNAARSTKSGAITIGIGGGETAMVGNPLQGALDLAAAMAKEAVEAKVAEAFAALDGAAAQAVGQVMAPVNDLAAQADAVGQAMADVGAGDVAALGSAGQLAAGLSSAVPTPSSAIQGALGGLMPAGWNGAENAAPAAEGSGGADGGGSSAANEAGPAAGVGATSDADNACGPGHSILDAKATHAENISSLRVVITAGRTTSSTTGARTSKAGAAKVELIAGNRTEACDATKAETAVGLVVLAGGNETETIEAARSTKVGGAILDKVSGGAALTAGGTIKMAGAYWRVKAKTAIVLKCGGSEVTITGGGIKFSSTLIQIAGASIKQTSTTDEGT